MTRQRLATAAAALVVATVLTATIFSMILQRVTLEGNGTSVTGPSTEQEPLVSGIGSVRNDSPWPIRITGAGEGGELFGSGIALGVFPGLPTNLSKIEWITTKHSVEVASNETVYLAFSVTATDDKPQGFSTVDVYYSDAIGRVNSTTATISMLGFAPGLPAGIASLDSTVDSPGYEQFLAGLLAALDSNGPELVAPYLGAAATERDAGSFLAEQVGAGLSYGYTARVITPSSAEIAFFQVSTDDALPSFIVEWSENRWSVIP